MEEEEKGGGGHGQPPSAVAGLAREQEEGDERLQPQLDSGDCLVQSVSDMDLIDHEELLVSDEPASRHPQQPTRLV